MKPDPVLPVPFGQRWVTTIPTDLFILPSFWYIDPSIQSKISQPIHRFNHPSTHLIVVPSLQLTVQNIHPPQHLFAHSSNLLPYLHLLMSNFPPFLSDSLSLHPFTLILFCPSISFSLPPSLPPAVPFVFLSSIQLSNNLFIRMSILHSSILAFINLSISLSLHPSLSPSFAPSPLCVSLSASFLPYRVLSIYSCLFIRP